MLPADVIARRRKARHWYLGYDVTGSIEEYLPGRGWMLSGAHCVMIGVKRENHSLEKGDELLKN